MRTISTVAALCLIASVSYVNATPVESSFPVFKNAEPAVQLAQGKRRDAEKRQSELKREEAKRRLERNREAAKDRRESARERGKDREEMRRESRKFQEEQDREARKHRKEMRGKRNKRN